MREGVYVRHRRSIGFVALLSALMLIAAACGGDDEGGGGKGATNQGGQKGGTYRVGYQEPFSFTDSFDPSGEYLGSAFGIYSNLLIRGLVGYNHVEGAAGNVIVPDLADVPEAEDGGTTYTFTIKDGTKWGPPLSRPITSDDALYAMERIANEKTAAQYGFYYHGIIEGMQDYLDGKADSISGIETPDDKTITFHLTEPVGDFLYRMAMPAAAPVPREIGSCFEDAGQYGRYVWSSGPYMIEGQDQTDTSSCDKIKPFSGFNPNKEMILVRNPDYDPATDSPEARENLPDEFHFLLNSNAKDIYDKVANSEYEDDVASEPPQTLRKYSTDPALKPLLKQNSGDRTWYINFDLTQPPFDDIHVRKAVNLVMDKEGIQRAWGGPVVGDIATHITPPAVTADHPTGDEYDPYPSANFAGDVDAAKEEMKQSKYDSDGDGLCDADVCKDILHFTRNYDPWTAAEPIIEASVEKIGLSLTTRELADFYTPWQTMNKTPPIGSGAGWGKDYADALTFAGTLFDSTSILPTGNTNVPLVGLTPALAQKGGIADLPGRVIDGIPSVDSDIDACSKLLDQERIDCWIELDKKLMEEVVPWVPYLWANNNTVIADDVTQWEFDQFSGYTAWAHVAVDQSKQNGL
jgi:peptide/nickel transport system substrate-binding protein